VVKPGAAALLETLLVPHQGQQEGKGGPRMQVVHIKAVDPVAAQLPGSPRAAAAAARPLEAHLHQPEPHRPSLPELELGEVLQPTLATCTGTQGSTAGSCRRGTPTGVNKGLQCRPTPGMTSSLHLSTLLMPRMAPLACRLPDCKAAAHGQHHPHADPVAHAAAVREAEPQEEPSLVG
jgi:hypothetical protein